jgi:hypothetical protein
MELMETLQSGASFNCMIQQTNSDDVASVIGYVNQIFLQPICSAHLGRPRAFSWPSVFAVKLCPHFEEPSHDGKAP